MASRLVKNVIEVNMISGPSSRRGDIPDGTVTYQAWVAASIQRTWRYARTV